MKEDMCVFNMFVLAIVVLAHIVSCCRSAQAETASDVKRVLVLHYENSGLVGAEVNLVNEGIRSVFANELQQKALELYIEYTDLARNTSQEYLDYLTKLFKSKYGDKPPDVIIANMNPYSEFVAERCTNLFPKAKFVFSLYERELIEAFGNYGGKATGVYCETTLDDSIKLIKKTLPDAENLFIVSGSSSMEKKDVEIIKKRYEKQDAGYNVVYYTDVSVDELLEKVRHLPANSAIYFSTYMASPDGTTYFSKNILSLVSKYANAPIFSSNYSSLGEGAVGAVVVSPLVLSKEAGELAGRLLAGESAESIVPIEVEGTETFDWRQLERWGIRESKLPGGSIIKYREDTLFEKYKLQIIFWAALVVFQFSIIAALAIALTRRKLAEEALRQSEIRFRTLVDNAPEGIFVQRHGRFLFMNREMAKLLGVTNQEELIGKEVITRIAAEYHENIEEHLLSPDVVDNTAPIREMEYIRLDGSRIPVAVTQVSIQFEGSSATLVFVRDITERKQIEARLIQAQKLESIGTLAGGIAHDFNNILSPIIGMSEMLLEDFPEGSPEYEKSDEIYKAAGRAGDLVRQILSFSRQSTEQKVPVLVQQILKEVLKLSRATLPANISIHSEIQHDCGKVLANPIQIHQVAMNLITNAYHAVEDAGGTITVRLKASLNCRDDIASETLPPGKNAILKVSDTGCGIDPSVVNKIFEPYFTTKPQDKGTGLGLSVVYGIVKDHGGEIQVASELGRGTTFTVCLPIVSAGTESDDSRLPDKRYTGDERILLVDDEAQLAGTATQMLERLGYSVTLKTSSVDALETFRLNPDHFDLVITDMTMPGLTGDVLAKEILKIKHEVPVIICTGFNDRIDPEKADAIGIRSFLMKPVSGSELSRTIRQALGQGDA